MLRAEKISPRACVADRCDGIEGKANEATLTSVDNHHDTLQDEAAAERPATTAVLTPPLSLEGGLAAEHRPPNLLRRVLSLFGNSHVFLGFGGSSKSVRGKILHSKTLKTIYEIDGQWDRIVKLKDVHSGEVTVLYDAKKAISGLKTPILQAPQNMWPTESATVWSEVSQAILNKEWGKASAAKQNVEEKQRKLQRERKSSGELWVPKHFTVTHTKDNEWDCSPLEQSVPPAPIIVPP
ncbi:Oxysterol-binding protein [Musa troglodytarum]|uniref:Oxysterol-binding protein n=1 Tax=Musa troglodytarum TaxID=320322 RepID=A0A9E7I276_9LILI|nr:Oxysterol-binding protein [Musa troglodytarum]